MNFRGSFRMDFRIRIGFRLLCIIINGINACRLPVSCMHAYCLGVAYTHIHAKVMSVQVATHTHTRWAMAGWGRRLGLFVSHRPGEA